MKKTRRGKKDKAGRVSGLLACLLTAFLLTGCGAASGRSALSEPQTENAAPAQAVEAETAYEAGGVSDTASLYGDGASLQAQEQSGEAPLNRESGVNIPTGENNRKLIRTVELRVESREYDGFLEALTDETRTRGGYIESIDSYNGSAYSSNRQERHASLTLRIPQEKLDDFLTTVSGIGNVTHRMENVEDVTLRYVDMESHRNALRTEQERLLSLLEQAQSIEDIIAIEGRLSEVRYQLESMESQLRTMDNQVNYSTVYLDVIEVKELTPAAERTLWERIRDGFAGSLRDIGRGAVDFAVWFMVNLPYLVLWAVGIAVLALLLRRCWKKRRNSGQQRRKKGSEKGAEDDGKNSL